MAPGQNCGGVLFAACDCEPLWSSYNPGRARCYHFSWWTWEGGTAASEAPVWPLGRPGSHEADMAATEDAGFYTETEECPPRGHRARGVVL